MLKVLPEDSISVQCISWRLNRGDSVLHPTVGGSTVFRPADSSREQSPNKLSETPTVSINWLRNIHCGSQWKYFRLINQFSVENSAFIGLLP